MSLNYRILSDIKFMSINYQKLSDIKFMSPNYRILSDLRFTSPNVRKSGTILKCYKFVYSNKLPPIFDILYRFINFSQEINESCQKNKRENQKIT